MAKSKNSNPLKTFNDNYDKKVKKVTEGNKKLVKAQTGTQLGPFIPDPENKIVLAGVHYADMLPSSKKQLDSLRNAKINEGYTSKDNKRAAEFYLSEWQRKNPKNKISPADTNNYDFMFTSKKLDPNQTGMTAIPKFILADKKGVKGVRMVKKNGGQTKSKKK